MQRILILIVDKNILVSNVFHVMKFLHYNLLVLVVNQRKYKSERSSFADINEKGWRGRASKHIFGSKSNRSKTISEIIKNSDSYSIVQHRLDSLKDIIGVKIDPNVTIDIHRIFRLHGSLK